MNYPVYSRAERIADGLVHGLGLGAAIIASTIFFAMLSGDLPTPTFAAIVIYVIGLIAMLGASTAYHAAAYTRARPVLRRLDHAAIFVKIAATFTPLAVLVNNPFAYVLLGAVWAFALTGAGRKLSAKRGAMPTGWLPYVALGWVGLALIVPLFWTVPGISLGLMIAGGATYSAGVMFYRWEGLRFSNAIWHGFVVVASGLFFAAIWTSVVAGLPVGI